MSEIATCAITSTLPAGRRRFPISPVVPPAVDFRMGERSRRVARRAGMRPKSIALSTATPSVKASMRASKRKLTWMASGPADPCETMRRRRVSAHCASRTPAAAPASANNKLSDSSWRIKRPRPAPMASRTANSFCLPVPRASNRFATLAQAMSNTSPTRAISTLSGSANAS